MKIFIDNITFEISSSKDLQLFTDFYESHLSHKKYSRTQLLSLNPLHTQPTSSPFEAFGGRGNKATKNRNLNLRRRKKEKKEKDDQYKAKKAHSKLTKASYDQQRMIHFNPFFHQVPGLLRKNKYQVEPLIKPMEKRCFERTYRMPEYYQEKLKARKDFLKTNYPLYNEGDFIFPSYSDCIEQLNAIYYDKVSFKPRYNEMWWTLHKAIEAGDTYLSSLSKSQKTINNLSFPTHKFEPTTQDLTFSYLIRSDFLSGHSEVMVETQIYKHTANLTDPILHIKEKYEDFFKRLKENLHNNIQNAEGVPGYLTIEDCINTYKTNYDYELRTYERVASNYITDYFKDPRNLHNLHLQSNMRSELSDLIRAASRSAL